MHMALYRGCRECESRTLSLYANTNSIIIHVQCYATTSKILIPCSVKFSVIIHQKLLHTQNYYGIFNLLWHAGMSTYAVQEF